MLKQIKVLELFAGSRSIGTEAERQGMQVFSVDWTQYENIDMVFFIENPRGILRHMPFMQSYKRQTVWYCKYGDDRAKPTDIWTNSTEWTPRKQCRNYKYDSEGNIINKHCHHESARRGAKTGTQGKKGSYNRSKIPQQLCEEILKSIK